MVGPGAKITITGVTELISALNGFKSRLPAAGKRTIENSMAQAESKAVSTVHVVSGDLRRSIRSRMEGNEKGMMGSSLEYAAAEERRGGPHRYIEPAYTQASKSFPEQYIKELNGILGAS